MPPEIRIDPDKLVALMQQAWREMHPVDRERLAQLADEQGGFFTRMRRVNGRVQVRFADVMLVDVPIDDVARATAGA